MTNVAHSDLRERIAKERAMQDAVWINRIPICLNREKPDIIPVPYSAKLCVKYCNDCGTFSYGLWRCALAEEIVKTDRGNTYSYHIIRPETIEIDENYVSGITVCPICGGELKDISKKAQYTEYFANHLDNNRIFRTMYYQSSVESDLGSCISRHGLATYESDHKAAAKKVEENTNLWDVVSAVQASTATTKIKESTENLTNYLRLLIQLESNIFGLTQRLEPLYFGFMQIQRRAKFGKYALEFLSNREAEFQNDVDDFRATANIEIPHVDYPAKPEPPVLSEPKGFLNSLLIKKQNAALTQEYERQLEKYHADYKASQEKEAKLLEKAKKNAEEEQKYRDKQAEDIESWFLSQCKRALKNEEVISQLPSNPVDDIFASVKTEIEEAEKLLQELYRARNELYSFNVVFAKYRDIVALSSFYEYLMSGRCTTLEGTNGAYNIYEAEIRQNRIISQLSTVIEKLEDIKQGQFMLYSELKSINRGIKQLNSKMDSAIQSLDTIGKNTSIIAENTERIAYNTEMTAFYERKNAELTDALGYMVAFK